MDISDLSTPALILDRGILARNVEAMSGRARALGVGLRPHLKTAKSADVARLALNSGGITVSTLHEAYYFLDNGIADITYAVGMAPGKLNAAASLMDKGADLKIITDNAGAARAIAGHGGPFHVLIEIDTGDGRGGVQPQGPELLDIARIIDGAGAASVAGVLTHAGNSYGCRDAECMAAVAEEERAGAVASAERLRAAGLPCPIISVGSTPTACFARDLTGVTEMRPGVYMFSDLFQAGIGTCGIDDIALSVLASVIGHRTNDNALVLDAGALALSKDRSTEKLEDDCGFGLVCDAVTGRPMGDLKVDRVHQEHGMVHSNAPLPFAALPVGALVRVLPNHACMTAAAYDAYHVIDGGPEVIDTWPRCNGW